MYSAKTPAALIGACLMGLSSHAALAQFGGYYVELSGGPAESTVEPLPPLSEGTVVSELEADSTMYAFTTGFRFNDNISVEASYADYGSFSGSATARDILFFQDVDPVTQEPVILQADALVQAETEYEAKAFTASVIGSWPVSRRFSVFGELGLAAWDVKSELAGTLTYTGEVQDTRRFTADFSDSGSSFFYSAGLHYRINLSYGVKLEFQENKFESDIFSSDAKVRNVNLGLRLYF
ncbi:outer membrane beta-barrel protein [Proteobacteria bacterium 005FR1]|nr:outer membrane beta-barrel protein [Proteobacteria bacterium 005FR1]